MNKFSFWNFCFFSTLLFVATPQVNGVDEAPRWDLLKGSLAGISAEVGVAIRYPNAGVPVSRLFVHLVKPGDTLERICRMYRADTETVARINQFDPSTPVRPGQELRIP
jgi:hypothetical protein